MVAADPITPRQQAFLSDLIARQRYTGNHCRPQMLAVLGVVAEDIMALVTSRQWAAIQSSGCEAEYIATLYRALMDYCLPDAMVVRLTKWGASRWIDAVLCGGRAMLLRRALIDDGLADCSTLTVAYRRKLYLILRAAARQFACNSRTQSGRKTL